MNLTAQQLEAVRDGEPVTLAIPEVGQDCVLLRADVFAWVKQLLENSGEITPRASYPAVLRAWDSVGSPEDRDLYRP